MNRIPKVIHYCWFGGNPLPESAKRYIETWKKYFPDYEIIEWNESNFDFNCCRYVKEAYEAGKWAFVSDYARYKILYEHGGVYFDTDVEVIRSFEDILDRGAFMGCENTTIESGTAINPGLGCAVAPGLGFYREVLEDYDKSSFYNEDGSLNLYTIVQRTTKLLKKHGLKNTMDIQQVAGIYIYPAEYFCPKDVHTKKLCITPNTYTIHHFDASWHDEVQKYATTIRMNLYKVLPLKVAAAIAAFIAIVKYRGIVEFIKVVYKKINKLDKYE